MPPLRSQRLPQAEERLCFLWVRSLLQDARLLLVQEDPSPQGVNFRLGQGQVLAPFGRHEGTSCAASLALLVAPAFT